MVNFQKGVLTIIFSYIDIMERFGDKIKLEFNLNHEEV